jgi:hypothetical protein
LRSKQRRRRSRSSRRSRTILRRRLVAVAVLLAAAGALALALGGGHAAHSSGGPGPAHDPAPAAAEAEAAARKALGRALRRGVAAAHRLGGSVEAAVMLGSWRAPVVATSERGGKRRWMRMWSMSKIVTAVALLRSRGWGEEPGKPLSPEVLESLQAAITRSENCPQRRIVLELQHALGDSTERARHAIATVLRIAGGRAQPGSEVAPPESSCIPFLETQTEIPDPLAPALLLGTSEWRVTDAVRFMHALGAGAYGRAVSQRLLALMREPKARSREIAPQEFTAPVDWGAGRALVAFDPAYKAGWGGTQESAFLAGQMALLRLPSGGRAAIAVMFHPAVQPAVDDPGLTRSPQALETVMRSLARELRER